MKDNNIKDTIEEKIYDALYYVNVYYIDIEKPICLKEKLNSKKYNRKSIYDEE